MTRIFATLLMSMFSVANAQTNLEQYLHRQQSKAQTQPSESVVPLAPGDPEKQADAFSRIFVTFCLKHITELEKLRLRMAMAPQIPKEKATPFLQGFQGEAWVIPEPSGKYVVALPKEQNICFLYGFRADQTLLEKQFGAIANAAVSSMTVKKTKDEKTKMPFGLLHTISYEWTLAGSAKKTILTLSTTLSDSAPMQAYASAGLVSQ